MGICAASPASSSTLPSSSSAAQSAPYQYAARGSLAGGPAALQRADSDASTMSVATPAKGAAAGGGGAGAGGGGSGGSAGGGIVIATGSSSSTTAAHRNDVKVLLRFGQPADVRRRLLATYGAVAGAVGPLDTYAAPPAAWVRTAEAIVAAVTRHRQGEGAEPISRRVSAANTAACLSAASTIALQPVADPRQLLVVASVLLVDLPEGEVIAVLATLLRRVGRGKLLLPLDINTWVLCMRAFDDLLIKLFPEVAAHIARVGSHPALLLIDLFTKLAVGSTLPFASVVRIVEVVVFQGFDGLCRLVISILAAHIDAILSAEDPATLATVIAGLRPGAVTQAFAGKVDERHFTSILSQLVELHRLYQVVMCVGYVVGELEEPTMPWPAVPHTWAAPLRMDGYHWVGFDLDHTLLQYKQEQVDELVFRCALRHVIKELPTYASLVKETDAYEASLAITGMVIDKVKGNILKLDAHNRPVMGYHGFRVLTRQELWAFYGGQPLPGYPSSTRFNTMHTCFERPMGPLFALLVDRSETLFSLPGVSRTASQDYSSIATELASSFRYVYSNFCKTGGFADVLADPTPHLIPQPKVRAWLTNLREKHGVRLFALTNAGYDHANSLMACSFGKDWLSLFDIVVVDAKKTSFFGAAAKLASVAPKHGAGTAAGADGSSASAAAAAAPGAKPAAGAKPHSGGHHGGGLHHGAGGGHYAGGHHAGGGATAALLRPFVPLNKDTGAKVTGKARSAPVLGGVYSGGNLQQLTELFEATVRADGSRRSGVVPGSRPTWSIKTGVAESKDETKTSDVHVCYFGDHLTQDIVLVHERGWHTISVVPAIAQIAPRVNAPVHGWRALFTVDNSDVLDSTPVDAAATANTAAYGCSFATNGVAGMHLDEYGAHLNAGCVGAGPSLSAHHVLSSSDLCVPSVEWLARVAPDGATPITPAAIAEAYQLPSDLRDLLLPVNLPKSLASRLCRGGKLPEGSPAELQRMLIASLVEYPARERFAPAVKLPIPVNRKAVLAAAICSAGGLESGVCTVATREQLMSGLSAARAQSVRITPDAFGLWRWHAVVTAVLTDAWLQAGEDPGALALKKAALRSAAVAISDEEV